MISILSGCLLALTATVALMADEQTPAQEAKDVAAPVVKAVSGEEAQALLEKKDAPIVIDLRTEEEFKEGHIEGAKRIDFKSPDFKKKIAELDRSKAYLFHCRSGGRSNQTLSLWKELGFEKLYHLDSGIIGWEKTGGKTVKGE